MHSTQTVIPIIHAHLLRAQRILSNKSLFLDTESHPGPHRLVPARQYIVAFLFCHIDLQAQVDLPDQSINQPIMMF